MVFGEIDAALNICKKAKDWWASKRRPVETVADRFLRLFETHGVHRNQIPRFFGHGITVHDVQATENLTAALTEQALQEACDLFGVKRTWLDGASDEVYDLLHCYKNPQRFRQLIDELVAKQATCSGYLLVGKEGKRPKYECYDAVLIIQEAIGSIEDKTIYRYHLCDQWIFDYWKCRAYLAACVAYTWSQEVYILGQYADRSLVTQVADGLTLIPTDNWGGGVASLGRRWHTEDLALRPEAFLDGLAERNHSGAESDGLSLWLELADQGWMTGRNGSTQRVEFEKSMAALRRG